MPSVGHRPSFVRTVRIGWLVFFDKNTPLLPKLIVLGAMLYGIAPIDLIPDFLPFIGTVDDVGIFCLALSVFLHMTKARRLFLEQHSSID